MADQPELGRLLEELSSAEDGVRQIRLRQHCEPLGASSAGAVLRGLLSSPVKWQREVAAEVANAMNFDPFSEEDEAEVEEEANVLTLGFEEDSVPPPPPAEDLDPEEPMVTFLDVCVEPPESGGEASRYGGGAASSVQRASLGVWVAFGVAALAGIMLLRWLTAEL
jgi:hypothetical protein